MLASDAPPIAPLYQLMVLPPAVDADKFTVPEPHRTPFVAVGADGEAVTVTVEVLADTLQP